MRSLARALVLCALIPLLHASCYHKPMKEEPNSPAMTHCQDDVDKTWHPMGSTWRNSACMDCSCGSCCDAYSTPRSFPDECTAEFDQQACEYKVVKKSDPSVPCPIFSAVGK